ncbi:hypothetical protein MPSEU_000118800 [Mayamaea pseudoterrestris]|nr:hypothetical protein MPSEU_000118800 [Mayamaea pseudoterrestris]
MVRLFGRSFGPTSSKGNGSRHANTNRKNNNGSSSSSISAMNVTNNNPQQQQQQQQSQTPLSTTKKKRLLKPCLTPQELREHHPMFQYAMDEYAQTISHVSSDENDILVDEDEQQHDYEANTAAESSQASAAIPPPSRQQYSKQQQYYSHSDRKTTTAAKDNSSAYSLLYYYEERYGPAYTGGTLSYVYPQGYQSMRPRSAPWKLSMIVFVLFTWLSVFIVGHCSSDNSTYVGNNAAASYSDYNNAAAADDAAAATYDDAASSSFYNNNQDVNYYNARWCGSKPLYGLWVASMLITGLSASYCGIIGYIKVRDFAVANVRSQPGWTCDNASGGDDCHALKSDYYVRIANHGHSYESSRPAAAASHYHNSHSSSSTSSQSYQYHPSIYQADGTPQFWGAHIYRPTQAAVAVTSR